MEKSSVYFQFKTLPIEPGVYQFFDKEDTVIYIGKAKNLKRRVASYFTKVHENAKTRVLVKKIDRMEHIVVPSEVDALLLENNLIKKYRPRYNILLKDDKTYPWICIKKEPFPSIFSTRKVIRDGSEYYGPYPNVKTLYTLIELIKDVYPFLNHELNHLIKVNDEKNIIKHDKNYGWPIITSGEEYFGGKIGEGSYSPEYESPLWTWIPSIAPSGMAFYDRNMFENFKGHLLIGSLKFKSLYLVKIKDNLPISEEIIFQNKIGRIRDVEVGMDGSIYLLTDEKNGGLFRLYKKELN